MGYQGAVCTVSLCVCVCAVAGVQVNSGAAKRFIRSALWEGDKEEEASSDKIKRKKRKLDTD